MPCLHITPQKQNLVFLVYGRFCTTIYYGGNRYLKGLSFCGGPRMFLGSPRGGHFLYLPLGPLYLGNVHLLSEGGGWVKNGGTMKN